MKNAGMARFPCFLAAVGMMGGVWRPDPRLGFVAVCLAGIGVYSAFGVWWSYPTTFLSGAAAAGAVGMINSFGNIGGYVGPFFRRVGQDADRLLSMGISVFLRCC